MLCKAFPPSTRSSNLISLSRSSLSTPRAPVTILAAWILCWRCIAASSKNSCGTDSSHVRYTSAGSIFLSFADERASIHTKVDAGDIHSHLTLPVQSDPTFRSWSICFLAACSGSLSHLFRSSVASDSTRPGRMTSRECLARRRMLRDPIRGRGLGSGRRPGG